MNRASHERWYRGDTSSVSTVVVALFTAAAIMFVTGLATALRPVPQLVTAAYYVSSMLVVVFLWAHSLQTVRRQ